MNFRLGSVRVRVSFLFFAVLTLLFVADRGEIALLSLICAALHESGHIAALLFFKIAPKEIRFGIFGVRIQHNNYALSDWAQLVIALCGPLVNLALFALSYVASLFWQNQPCLIFCAVNLVMGTFNLVPILPLDGGRALEILLGRFFSDVCVRRIMGAVCIVMISGLILTGIFLAVKTGLNVSLLATGVYLLALCIKSIIIGY